MTFTHALSTNRYGESDLIVSTSAANGTHTTLASAMAAATSGQTIFLRDSVTENVTITPGVNISAWSGGSLNTPSITGTLTMTAAGTSTISGVELITNGANPLLTVSGSAASILKLDNCYLNCSANTGISYTSSSSSSRITLNNCYGNLGTTGIGLYSMSSAGILSLRFSLITNTGASTTASSNSAGSVVFTYSAIDSPISNSSTGILSIFQTLVDTSAINVTAVTTAGTGASGFALSQASSGTATAVTVGAGTTLNIGNSSFLSTNATAVISGAGAYSTVGSALPANGLVTVTTQNSSGAASGLTQGTAPAAGYVGQRIVSAATSVATTSATAKTIASISITPGIWSVTALATSVATGGTGVQQAQVVSISTTDNTIEGNAGDQKVQNNNNASTGSVYSGTVTDFPVNIAATTTYYLVVSNTYSSTTCPTSGRISARRVG